MNKLTAEKCREQFEEWYSKIKGTPLSVLMVLRDGDNYKETDGERLDISWLAWQASREAIPTLEHQERGEWVEWKGGSKAPLESGLMVDLKLRDGSITAGYPSGACNWTHYHSNNGSDIVAYRIIPERSTNQNGEQ